ncbi:MAG: sigma-70 family RNA polymerase sigma factor [Pyrinomonadaceae bacterium]
MAQNTDITRLLQEGNARALEELFPIVYVELREIAAALFRNEHRINHTLQPTALVHEAFMRLVGGENEISWQSRAHFFGIAARSMRQILVNHAEARNAKKRGGGNTILALDDAISFFQTQDIEILALHEALEKMATLDKRQAEIVELKFFGGLNAEEIAEVLQISVSTVTREWEMARSWLYRELKK